MVNINLIRDNCLNQMKNIKKRSIDCILTDLPYGITKNEWDIEIDLKLLWENFNKTEWYYYINSSSTIYF